MTLGSQGDPYTRTSAPQQWDYYVVNIDQNSFNFNMDNLAVAWSIDSNQQQGGSSSSQGPANFFNTFITIDENSFPQFMLLNTGGLRTGWQVFYSQLAAGGQIPLPMEVRGQARKQPAPTHARTMPSPPPHTHMHAGTHA